MKTSNMILGVLVLVAAVALVVFGVQGKLSPRMQEEVVVQDQQSAADATTFAWHYEKGSTDPDGLPRTRIFLDVRYESGKTLSQEIEEVQGSCNAVDPAAEDADRVSGTDKIQCYAAGFGEMYKIVKGDDTYEIRRKYIEEGVPELPPQDFQYETVKEVPLVL